MLISQELMDRVNDLAWKLDHLEKVSYVIDYFIGFDFYVESKQEISSLYSIFQKYLVDACEEYEKIIRELEFGKREEQKETEEN